MLLSVGGPRYPLEGEEVDEGLGYDGMRSNEISFFTVAFSARKIPYHDRQIK